MAYGVVVVFVGIFGAGGMPSAFAKDFVSVVGSSAGVASQSETARAFTKSTGHRVDVISQADSRVFRWLEQGRIDVGMWSPTTDIRLNAAVLEHSRRSNTQPMVFSAGQFAVCVVVHPLNPVRELTVSQLRKIFVGSVTDWSQLGGPPGKIIICGERPQSKSREIVSHTFLSSFDSIIPISESKDLKGVAETVAKERRAIGFGLYRQQPVENVAIVSIAIEEDGPFFLPNDEAIFARNYPLAEDLYLILRPDAQPQAHDYVKFALGPEGAKIAKKWLLFPELERLRWLAKKRLDDSLAGRAQVVHVLGPQSSYKFASDLGLKYVEMKEAMVMRYEREDASSEAMRNFREDGPKLLLQNGPLDEGLVEELGEGYQSVPLGYRALGVIVHPEIGLQAVSVEELRQIVAGDIKHWPAATGDGATIRGYALHGSQVVMQIYWDKLAEPRGDRKSGGMKLASQADSAQVVLAVARDPAGIGFVDLSQTPPLDGSVVLLGLIGQDGIVSQPQPSQAPDDYPLAKPLNLYVSPNAGEAAKRFSAWLAENPCTDVLAMHGLVPPKVAAAKTRPTHSNELAPAEPRERAGRESHKAGSDNSDVPVAGSPNDQLARVPKTRSRPKHVASLPRHPQQSDVRRTESSDIPAGGSSSASGATLSTDEIGLIVAVIAGLVLLLIVVSAAFRPRRKRIRRR
jgi:ABC-type phosphate transport system substrate-binding protein